MSNDGLLEELDLGIHLFNRGQFFEAHEALEDVWRSLSESESIHPRGDASESRSPRLHVQALIQLAVAFHHQSTGNILGASSVLERTLRNLHGAEHSFPGLNLDRLRAELAPWQQYLKARAVDSGTSQDISSEIAPPLPKIVRRW